MIELPNQTEVEMVDALGDFRPKKPPLPRACQLPNPPTASDRRSVLRAGRAGPPRRPVVRAAAGRAAARDDRRNGAARRASPRAGCSVAAPRRERVAQP